MLISETRIAGVYSIGIDRREDERGYFARTFCVEEFSAAGLKPAVAQANISFNLRRGTLRGLHFRYPPTAETKYVRCSRGAILDVVVDLRPESPTYLDHIMKRLSAENGRGLYIPERFAHGFVTLEDDTEVTYMMGEAYRPGSEGGLRYDDPMLGLSWPVPVRTISARDTAWQFVADIDSDLRTRMSVCSLVA